MAKSFAAKSFASSAAKSFAASNKSVLIEAFEIEEAPQTSSSRGSGASISGEHHRAPFPISCCPCCPAGVRRCLPKTWTLVHNWTHFSLLAGITAVIVIFGIHIRYVLNKMSCRSPLCVEEALVLLFVVPSAFYMNKMLERYDEQVQAKRHAVAERKEELAANVDHLISNMDNILGKVTESSAMLAERSIESHRRAFQRFLQYLSQKFARSPMSVDESENLLFEVKRLIKRWLAAFEECSVDPIGQPRRIVTEQELNQCHSVPELAQLVTDRLKLSEVRFISLQKEEDTKMLEGLYSGSRRLTSTEIPNLETFATTFQSGKKSPTPKTCCKGCDWMKIQGWGCSYARSDEAGEGQAYPVDIQVAVLWISVVSRNHLVLLITFLSAFILFSIEFTRRGDIPYLISLCFYEMCVIVMLVRFEDLDLIRRLEREVQKLTEENKRIKDREENICSFWDGVNDLTELWVHRTVPRLELMKEVQGHVEDAARDGIDVLLPMLEASNNQLEYLDANLGELNMWRMSSGTSSDRKKLFGERIMNLCRGSTIECITGGLDKVIEDLQQTKPAELDFDHADTMDRNQQFDELVEFLQQVPLIMRLPKDQHPLLAAACKMRDFQRGEVLIQQGDIGREFFVIRSGEAKVTSRDLAGREKHVATLKSGDYVGETALIRDEPRAATVSATTQVSALVIDQQDFEKLNLTSKLQFANRKAVGGGGNRRIPTKPATPKTADDNRLISEALWKNENLQTMVQLSDKRVHQILNIMWKENVGAGKMLMKEGDLNSDYFYVVQEGSFEIFVTVRGVIKVLTTATRGASFGELALLYLTPRAASVKAISDSVVWVIDRVNFKEVLVKASEEKIKEYVAILDKVEILSGLLAEEKRALANALSAINYTKGEVILRQGEVGNTFYILYDGDVTVSVTGKGKVAKLSATAAGTQDKRESDAAVYFGERALQNEEVRSATVTVSSTTASVLAMDRSTFTDLLGTLGTAMVEHSDNQSNRTTNWKRGTVAHKSPHEAGGSKDAIRFQDLKTVGLLGCGTFGYVELQEHTKTGHTYAMKTMSKGFIVRANMQDSVMSEKKILMMTNSPFVIKLFATFNERESIAFLMEPALGGELLTVYKTKGFYGEEKHAKFYSACVTLALDHLHARRIIYRDLKPENLVLNKHGIAKLIDMGLAKFVIGRTFTTCGTPEYFSPEMISSTGHTNATDWWALGILCFELMSGHTPFAAVHPMGIYSNVVKGIDKVKFPPKCQGVVKDFITNLLQQDPSWRLPMKPGGVQNLKSHPWFSLYDWDSLQALQLEPPFKPTVRNKKDLSNIKANRDDIPKPVDYIDDGSGWDKDFATA